MDDAMLQRFAAESYITRIIHLYCHALDRRPWELTAQVFHHDARYGSGDIGGDWRDFFRTARSIVDPVGPCHHLAANVLMEIDGGLSKIPQPILGKRVDEDGSLPVVARLPGRTT